MLRLRPYKKCDAKHLVSWFDDEMTFRKWCSDRFENYPVSEDDINEKYFDLNGDCFEDNFYPFTAFDESGIVGSMILRFTDDEKKTIRFGFVVIDSSKRGKGCGRQMLTLAQKFAFEILGAEKITIGVFDNNPSAYNCYKAVGFKDVEQNEYHYFNFKGENWKVLELEIIK